MRVLLVSTPGEARTRYERTLNDLGIVYDAVSSLSELHDELTKKPYNGILLDVPTMIRANASEKALTHDLLDLFPALRLSWDAEEQRIRAMYYGQTGETNNRLEEFLESKAKSFPARTIRRAGRKDLGLSVMLAREDGQDTEQTAVLNLSMAGCFVVTSQPWEEGEIALLTLPDLADQTPIRTACRRVVPWGAGHRLPGIGVRFDAMSDTQLQEIETLIQRPPLSAERSELA